jgi:hypothetical protein
MPVKFFIPHLRDDPSTAEAEWERYMRESSAPPGSRRVYSLTDEHEGDRCEVTVGEKRKRYARKTGPRGGYIKDAGQQRWATGTGTIVSGIIDAGEQLYVWSYGPPFGRWGNPTFVGRNEVRAVEYFEDPGGETGTENPQAAQGSPGRSPGQGLVRLHPGQIRDDHARHRGDDPSDGHDEHPGAHPARGPAEPLRPLTRGAGRDPREIISGGRLRGRPVHGVERPRGSNRWPGRRPALRGAR